jgi:hypothetical protein
MYCKSCGGIIQADSVFCPTCGNAIIAESSPLQEENQYSAPGSAPLNDVSFPPPTGAVAFTASTSARFPALDQWKTSVGLSILGLAAAYLSALITSYIANTSNSLALVIFVLIMSILFLVFELIYVLIVYPSYFKETPFLTNPSAISFLNCFCGGIVFGLLWNSGLTNGKKGIAHIVYAVLIISVNAADLIFLFK